MRSSTDLLTAHPTLAARLLPALLLAAAALCTPGAQAAGFASTQPAAPVAYWQQRQATIRAQVADADSLRAVWDESFGGAAPQNRALNIGTSGDRTEPLLFRFRPKAQSPEFVGFTTWLDLFPSFCRRPAPQRGGLPRLA